LDLEILTESDLETVLTSDSVKTVWQRDPLIKKETANTAARKYIDKVIGQGMSLGSREKDSLSCLAVGSIPQWDTDFFGFKSYALRYLHYNSLEVLSRFIDSLENWLAEQKVRYSYVKLPAEMMPAIRVFEKHGFSMADLRVTFNRRIQDEVEFPTDHGDLVFDIAEDDEIEEVAEISRLVSKADRFHADPNIPVELADELYYRWVVNGAKAGKDVAYKLIKSSATPEENLRLYKQFGTAKIGVALPAIVVVKMCAAGEAERGVIAPECLDAKKFLKTMADEGAPVQFEEICSKEVSVC